MNEQAVKLPSGVGMMANITELWLRGELDGKPTIDELTYFADHVWPTSGLRQVPAVASRITRLFDDSARRWEFITNSQLALSLKPPGNPVQDIIEVAATVVPKNSWDKLADDVRRATGMRAPEPEPEVKPEDLKRQVSVIVLSGRLTTYDNIVTVDMQQNYVVIYKDSEFGGERYIYNRDEIRLIEIEPDVQLIEDSQ